MDRALPEITGFNSVASNLGEIKNKGFEISLNANIIRKENFTWSASGNFSLNRRKITHLYGEMEDVLDENGNVIVKKKRMMLRTNGLSDMIRNRSGIMCVMAYGRWAKLKRLPNTVASLVILNIWIWIKME